MKFTRITLIFVTLIFGSLIFISHADESDDELKNLKNLDSTTIIIAIDSIGNVTKINPEEEGREEIIFFPRRMQNSDYVPCEDGEMRDNKGQCREILW